MHNLFSVYFVNLYMFRAYLDPSSGGTTVCIQLVLIILFRLLSIVLFGWNNPTRTTRLTKYTVNKLCIKLVFFTRLYRGERSTKRKIYN